jgi:hypothetical protein
MSLKNGYPIFLIEHNECAILNIDNQILLILDIEQALYLFVLVFIAQQVGLVNQLIKLEIVELQGGVGGALQGGLVLVDQQVVPGPLYLLYHPGHQLVFC